MDNMTNSRGGQLRLLAAKMISPVYGGIGAILAFHRVIPAPLMSGVALNRDLEITPDYLSEVLESLKRWGYDFSSMDELPERLGSRRPGKFVCLTLDDGYRDNLEHALPVFKAHQAPFTVYLTTSFATRGLLWWYGLEQIFQQQAEIRFVNRGAEQVYPVATGGQKEAAMAAISGLIRNMDRPTRNEFILQLFAANGIDAFAAARELAMNWDEIQLLAREPLAAIGAHSVEHHTFMHLSVEDLRRELSGSKAEIETKLGRKVNHFSFPFGSPNAVGQREVQMGRECGFATLVTTRAGSLFAAHRHHLHCLPRRYVSEDLNEFRRQLLGWSNFRNHPRRRVVLL